MSEYMPVSPRAKRLYEGGADIEDVRALDAMEMAAAQAQLYERIPAARDPRFQERVNEELAAHSGEYSAVAQSAGTLAGYELAVGRVLSQGDPSGAGGASPGHSARGFEAFEAQRQRAREVQEYVKATGDELGATRAVHPGFADHPGLLDDPRGR